MRDPQYLLLNLILPKCWYRDDSIPAVFRSWPQILCFPAGSQLQDSAFGYFITACVVILLAIVSYFALPKLVWCESWLLTFTCVSFPPISAENYDWTFTCLSLKLFVPQEFFQYYSESNGSRSIADEENKMDLLKPGKAQRSITLSKCSLNIWCHHEHLMPVKHSWTNIWDHRELHWFWL